MRSSNRALAIFLQVLVSMGLLVVDSPKPAIADLAIPGLVNWWRGDGDARDSVGANDGILAGGVEFAQGRVGQAFSFGGVDGFVTFGNVVGNFGTSDFTVDFWMKTSSTRTEGILGKRPICTHSSFWDIRVNGFFAPNRLTIELDQDGVATNYNQVFSNAVVNDGQWHLAAIVRSGTTLLVYIDGVLDSVGTTSGVTNIMNFADLRAGTSTCTADIDGTHSFTGLVDEIQIYDRALSASEIQAIFLAVPAPAPLNLNLVMAEMIGADTFAVDASFQKLADEMCGVSLSFTINGRAITLESQTESAATSGTVRVIGELDSLGVPRFDSNQTFDVAGDLKCSGRSAAALPRHVRIPLPTVLVHGLQILGPNPWEPLVAVLAQDGYREFGQGPYPTLLVFPYLSLEQDNSVTAKMLGDNIETFLKATHASKVNIVAHSLGGLIARAYTNMLPGRVRHLIMLGTPNEGTPLALAFLAILPYSEAIGGAVNALFGNVFDDLISTVESTIDLLPVYPFLKFSKHQHAFLNPVANLNRFLEHLNAQPPALGVTYDTLYGSGHSTIETITLNGLVPIPGLGPGDWVVPTRSVRGDDIRGFGNAVRTWDMGTVCHTAIRLLCANAATLVNDVGVMAKVLELLRE